MSEKVQAAEINVRIRTTPNLGRVLEVTIQSLQIVSLEDAGLRG